MHLEQNARRLESSGEATNVLERCTIQRDKCEEDKVRLKQEVHEKEQRQWQRAEAATARERSATERLKKCNTDGAEARKKDRERFEEEIRARLEDQEKALKEEQ